jgi:flavin-dependent dehydrogenase
MDISSIWHHLQCWFWHAFTSRFENKINLNKALFDIIQEFPELKHRFSTAVMKSKPQGFGLALGTRKLSISGPRFLLCGDAASLIDPFSGDGIANAMISGHLAAQHILTQKNNLIFSEAINKEYDHSVYSLIWNDLKKKTYILRTVYHFPFLIELGIRLSSFLTKFRLK